MFEKILVCLDGSSLAEQILPHATEQALRFGSKVVLLQVVPIPSTVYFLAAPGGLPSGLVQNVLSDEIQRAVNSAQDYLERVAQPLRKRGLDLECVTLLGTPGAAIISYAETNEVNLIAIATHGHGGLKRLVFGSVADHVLKESPVPLLLVRPQAANPERSRHN